MALKYIDGFAHYTTAEVTGSATRLFNVAPDLWSFGYNQSVIAGTTYYHIWTMPSLGTKGVRLLPYYAASSQGGWALALKSPVSFVSGGTIGVGFHFYAENFTDTRGLFGFTNGPSNNTSRTFSVGTSGNLRYYSGGQVSGTLLGDSGSNLLSTQTLYHFEAKIYLHDTAGTVDVRINGQPFMSITNVDTLSTDWTHISFGGAVSANAGSWYLTNLFIWDDSGSVNNDWLGERIVYTIFPDADTADADWTLSTGSDGYNLINDVPPDGDTNYLESATAGDESIFGLQDLPVAGVSISGIQVFAHAKKDEAAEASILAGPVTSGGTKIYPADAFLATKDQYLYTFNVTETNPDTSAPWTASDLAAVKLGLKRNS